MFVLDFERKSTFNIKDVNVNVFLVLQVV